jgi:hypothetical protein
MAGKIKKESSRTESKAEAEELLNKLHESVGKIKMVSSRELKAETEELLNKRRAAMAQATPGAVVDITFRDFVIDHYLKAPETLALTALVRNNWQEIALKEICDGLDAKVGKGVAIRNPCALGKLKLSEINDKRIEEYINVKRSRGDAIANCNGHIDLIKKVLKVAYKSGNL